MRLDSYHFARGNSHFAKLGESLAPDCCRYSALPSVLFSAVLLSLPVLVFVPLHSGYLRPDLHLGAGRSAQ